MSDALGYARFELLRTFRNQRLYIFSFAFPVVLYYAIAGPNRHEHDIGGTGIAASVYFMVGLAAFGGDDRRARLRRADRGRAGRRLEPAAASHAAFDPHVLPREGADRVCDGAGHARPPVHRRADDGRPSRAGNWLQMTILMLIGLAPFAAIGILLGHLLTADSIGPAIGGVTAVFALLGGVWFPITHGAMQEVAKALPSYWLVQASRVGLGGHGWGATGWFVVAAWTIAAAAAARRAYARDTQRV